MASSSAHTQSMFPPTRWTQVMSLQKDDTGEDAQRTLASLCDQYWYPLYAFARRVGRSPHDCQDLTQGFFCYILENKLFAEADPELGKMRTFLLHAFRRYINSQDRHHRALKRGGGRELLSLDLDEGEGRYQLEPADHITPELMYERAWAQEVLIQVHAELGRQEEAAGRGEIFRQVAGMIATDSSETGAGQEAARVLNMSYDAVRQAVTRLRRRFRALLRQQIADTLRHPDAQAVDAELQSLRSAIAMQPIKSAGAVN